MYNPALREILPEKINTYMVSVTTYFSIYFPDKLYIHISLLKIHPVEYCA